MYPPPGRYLSCPVGARMLGHGQHQNGISLHVKLIYITKCLEQFSHTQFSKYKYDRLVYFPTKNSAYFHWFAKYLIVSRQQTNGQQGKNTFCFRIPLKQTAMMCTPTAFWLSSTIWTADNSFVLLLFIENSFEFEHLILNSTNNHESHNWRACKKIWKPLILKAQTKVIMGIIWYNCLWLLAA